MKHLEVYVGIKVGYLRSTMVKLNGKVTRYILGRDNLLQRHPVYLPDEINLEIWELTDIKNEEDLQTYFLSQQLLGGQ